MARCRLKLNKIDREKLKQKYCGRCAYCGAQLGSRWHADHLDPVERSWEYYKKPNGMLGTRTTGMTKPENDRLDNLMPSCVKCNNDKLNLTLEDWRRWIKGRIQTLNEDPRYASYQKAKRFGLVVETDIDVVFYFEKQPQVG